MNNNQTLFWIRFAMKNVNFIIIMLFSALMYFTARRITDTMEAYKFLDKLEVLPVIPDRGALMACMAFLLLLLLMVLGKKDCWSNWMYVGYGAIQLLLSFLIMKSLSFSYNGILLLLIIDLLISWRNTGTKVVFISLLVLLYGVTGLGVISAAEGQSSVLQAYLLYYNTDVRSILLVIKSLLVSVNNLLFMLYLVILIRVQLLENRRISALNNRLDETNEKLKEANVQLEEYARTTEKMVQSRERNRLAREIHDTLGHTLTGIIAGIDASLMLVDIAPKEVKQQLEVIGKTARQGMSDVRRSVSALRPDALERLSLPEAVEKIIVEMKTISKADIFYRMNADMTNLDEDEEEVIYRIIQEGITNALRHGKADRIEIDISELHNIITVIIQDNGTGCRNIKRGFGLRHMAERLELLNGKIDYNGDNGFVLKAVIPIRWGK
ncbi:sensor histidine kinase [Anaerocolumna jejuensis]|uniref:sensor histidine kinase n=1 Tax=Anaerocolumna jejuensis TaxID=259063 RepID=UPI003F7CC6D3